MKVEELALKCMDAIRHPDRSLPDKPLITLVGKHQLFPHGGGPRAKRLLCVNSDGDRVYHYDAMNVLAALAADEMIGVEVSDSQIKLLWVKEKPNPASGPPA